MVDLEARPGPAAAHRHRGQVPQAPRRPRAYTGRCLAISHVIPLRMFLVLKWDRWYSTVFELLVNEVLGELRATFRGGTVRCPAVSHAIPPEYVAGSYHFVLLSHSCLGIACDFEEGVRIREGATEAQLSRNWGRWGAGRNWGVQLGPKSRVFAGGKKFGRKRMTG